MKWLEMKMYHTGSMSPLLVSWDRMHCCAKWIVVQDGNCLDVLGQRV